MKILDTNTLTHLFGGHARTIERFQTETEDVAATIVSRIEILQGRFAMLLKAAGAEVVSNPPFPMVAGDRRTVTLGHP